MEKIVSIILILFFFMPVFANAEDFYDDNLVIVMDCSGSMDGTKIAQAKSALKEVLKHVPPTTHIGLLSFGSSEGWRYPLGPRDEEKLIQAIDALRTGGGTPLGEYIKKGAERLLRQKGKQLGYGTYRLLVITDGEADDQNLVNGYTPGIMARGITVDVIGVFMDKKHTLSRTTHSYREAQDTASLKQAIAEVLAEISDQGAGPTTVDAFAEIAGLPDEMVPRLVRAISSSPEGPLAKAPIKKLIPQKKIAAHKKPQPQTAKKSKDGFPLIAVFLIIFAAIFIFQFFKKKK